MTRPKEFNVVPDPQGRAPWVVIEIDYQDLEDQVTQKGLFWDRVLAIDVENLLRCREEEDPSLLTVSIRLSPEILATLRGLIIREIAWLERQQAQAQAFANVGSPVIDEGEIPELRKLLTQLPRKGGEISGRRAKDSKS